MRPTENELIAIDAAWQQVAQHLGSDWQWSRRRSGDSEAETRCGWLRGPGGLGLCTQLDQPRWEIRESLDTLVPETGERLFVQHLYGTNEPNPVMAITVARDRPACAIAREIQRRLLPSVRESLARVEACRQERSAHFRRQRHALEAIRGLCSSAHQCDPQTFGAPRLYLDLGRTSLDVRIDDSDSITITRWSGLNLETVLRLVELALRQ